MLFLHILIITIALFQPPAEITEEPQQVISGSQAVPIGELNKSERAATDIRKLDFLRAVEYEEVNEDELKAFINKKLDEEYPEDKFQNDLAAYKALGLLDDVSGIRKLLIELYTEQVAAFYDPESHRLFSRSKSPFSEMLNDIILVHELTHALQDQHFDLEKLLQQVKDDNDKLMARVSLVEGDATLAQIRYMLERRSWKLREMFGVAFQQQDKFFSAPYFVRKNLLFPYEKGVQYVTALYESNGWDAVNAAYADPPVSSEQILHPEKYIDSRDDPQKVSIPDLSPVLGEGWELVSSNNLGELNTMVMFRQYLGMFRAKKPADGWDGDWYNYYVNSNNGRQALIWATAWDSVKDAEEFFASYCKLVKKKFDGRKLLNFREKTNSALWQYDQVAVFVGRSDERNLVVEVPMIDLLVRVTDKFAEFSLPDNINLDEKKGEL